MQKLKSMIKEVDTRERLNGDSAYREFLRRDVTSLRVSVARRMIWLWTPGSSSRARAVRASRGPAAGREEVYAPVWPQGNAAFPTTFH